MNKEILFNQDARKKIIDGLNVAARAVVSTLGPRGQNVIFEDSIYPTITKDGVTVAQQVFLEDKFENMGVMMAREAAENTNREAGDGTTTTVLLLSTLINEANKYIITGMNPFLLKKGIDIGKDIVLSLLERQVKKLETLEDKKSVAIISANNDEKLGSLIAEVIDTTGLDGIVTVQTVADNKIDVEYIKGMRITSGYESSAFINNQKRLSANLENPAIVITSDNLLTQNQLIAMVQTALNAGKREIVLFANRIEGAALAFLVQNHMLGKFTCVPVKFSSYSDFKHELLYDLATLVNAKVVGDEESVSLDNITSDCFGTCKTAIINRDTTIISGGDGDVTGRIEEVKALMEDEKDTYIIDRLKDRLGRLTGSIANIKVGGASETEQTEIKYRIEDAINATRSAIQDGIVEGGGVALIKCYKDFKPEMHAEHPDVIAGIEIVKKSLLAPLRTIVNNGGGNGDAIIGKVIDSNTGYNALTEEFGDLLEMGVIDPVKVVRNEVINACATAGILLTSGAAITIKKEK
jgi:chaperonin GroEL